MECMITCGVFGVRSLECMEFGDWRLEFGVWSVKCMECGVCGVLSVWSAWSVKCLKCGVHL